MILIGLGANLPSLAFGAPAATLHGALGLLREAGFAVPAVSRWYESAPVPASDQPWFVNGVARIETDLAPGAVLDALLAVEARVGRVRGERNAPRVLDLDLLAYDDLISDRPPILPHPRLRDRAFVLLPLREIAPDWRHPATGETIDAMLARIPPGQETRVMTDG